MVLPHLMGQPLSISNRLGRTGRRTLITHKFPYMKHIYKIILLVLLTSPQAVLSQGLKKVVTYYDPITRTKVNESYTTLTTAPYAMHGVYEKYDAYGALMTRGTYSNGKKNGTFTNYFSTEMTGIYGKGSLGKVWTVTTYVNDKENGVDKMFSFNNGQLVLIKQYTWNMGTKIKDEEWNEAGKQTKLIQTNGPCFEFHTNGNKKLEYTSRNGKYEGSYTSWYPNGQVEASTTYINNQENGKHVEFFESRKTQLEATYVKGKLSGDVMLYFENGKTAKTLHYDPSSFNLTYEKEFALNALPKFERQVITGSQCKSINYDTINGGKISETDELYDAATGTYLKNGKAIKYFQNGKVLAEASFERGIIQGRYVEYDEDGEVIKSGDYVEGSPVGEWLYYYDEDWNQIKSKKHATYFRKVNYNSNLGPWPTTDYFISGEKQFEGMLAKINPDQPVGKCTYYYDNGATQQTLDVANDGSVKSLKMYSQDGKLDKEGVGENTAYGAGINWIEYYPDGKVKAKGKTVGDEKIGTWTYYDESGNARQTLER